jgi:reductive dehalogenase
MRKLTLEQWERKYVVGPVNRFDQRYTMFNRPVWDPDVKDRIDNWSFGGDIRDRPGYGLWELALDRASSRATQLALFNVYKPNPGPATMALMGARGRGRPEARTGGQATSERGRVEIDDAEAATRNIKKAARYFGTDLAGVCRLDRRWVYSHSFVGDGSSFEGSAGSAGGNGGSVLQEIPDDFQYAVVMGFEMEYNLLRHHPSYVAETATAMGYSRMAIANAQLAAFIRGLGYRTIDCSINDVALSVPLALLAGLGDLGRNGILVTPEFGPRLRLSKVLTDMPLTADAPVDFGVTEFCEGCERCAEVCPSQSIPRGPRTSQPTSPSNVPGVLKWPVQAETCRMHWARSNKSCSTCIACCPYNKPDTAFHRTARWLTDHARWGDPLYLRADRMLGYGKPVKPVTFWEDWQPQRNQKRPVK